MHFQAQFTMKFNVSLHNTASTYIYDLMSRAFCIAQRLACTSCMIRSFIFSFLFLVIAW